MQDINEEQVEGKPETSYGKFKSADALYSAYTNLEAEFTKKCQQLKEKSELIENTQVPIYEREGWQEMLTEFMKTNPEAQGHAHDIGAQLINDPGLAKQSDGLYRAYLNVVKTKYINPADEGFKKKIINDYLKSVKVSAPDIMGRGGELFAAPPKKPKTLKEAGEMAAKSMK